MLKIFVAFLAFYVFAATFSASAFDDYRRSTERFSFLKQKLQKRRQEIEKRASSYPQWLKDSSTAEEKETGDDSNILVHEQLTLVPAVKRSDVPKMASESRSQELAQVDEANSNTIDFNYSADKTNEAYSEVSDHMKNYDIPHPKNLERPFLKHSCLKKTGKIYEHRTYPRSYEHAGFEASLPREWDWRNVSDVNYCSPNRNQHIPVYCGSCWVFGALGALNDRFNIARKNRWPMTVLSPQEIIACGGKGTCDGGEAGGVYEYAKTNGLVEEGCNNYKAINEQCDAFSRCGTCWSDNCFSVANYTRYRVKDYGVVRGRLAMMAEIHNRGPIACSTGATVPFELHYNGGIYAEYSDLPSNHVVAVAGWGYDEESKTEYWIVRNSWGDAWGEKGWFRVVTSIYRGGRGDQYNLGIERECVFADPDVSNLD